MSTGLLIAIAGRLETANATKNACQALWSIEKNPQRCPHCSGVLYSRRFPTCRECGEELPGRSRLAPSQVKQVQAELNGSRSRMDRLDASYGAIRPIGTFRI